MISEASFIHFLTNRCRVSLSNRFVVAVSGGPDSMALLHLFQKSGIPFVAAHCNFHLRGPESDGDERFVTEACSKMSVTLVVKHFNTVLHAREQGVSIEMAARELRYHWFDQLMKDHQCQYVATGHHADDSMETFFLNLSRGTGIKGLSGISERSGNVIRPLMFASREEILAYCSAQSVDFRQDSSNADDRFNRNFVRNQIIPLFLKLNPSFLQTMKENMSILNQTESYLAEKIQEDIEHMMVKEDETELLPISLIRDHRHPFFLLFEYLHPKGFNSHQVNEIIDSLDSIPGKQFYSSHYRLIRDRYNLIVMKIREQSNTVFYINSGQISLDSPLRLVFKELNKDENFSWSTDLSCIHLDAGLIEYPLVLRKWEQGDAFKPLGMKGFKKVSDFFIDQKLSLPEKESKWILLSGQEIVWVVAMRIDDRFKVTDKTQRVLEIRLETP